MRDIWVRFNAGKWHLGTEIVDIVECFCHYKPKLIVGLDVDIRKTRPKDNLCKKCGI